MDRHQKNKLTMYNITERVLDDNTSIWNVIPAFVIAKNTFSTLIPNIHKASAKQDARTTGIATDKRIMKKALADCAAVIAAILSAFASDIGNNEIREAVAFTSRKLFKCRDNKMLSHCSNIYKLALANAAALLPYGVTALNISQLQTSINGFKNYAPKTRAARVTKQTHTKNLKRLFAKTDELLRMQLDNMVVFAQSR